MNIGDRVRVFATRQDSRPPFETKTSCIHRGRVIGLTTSHARVLDMQSESDHVGTAELFPIQSKRIWIEPA